MTKIRTQNLSPLQRKLAKKMCTFVMKKFMPRAHDTISIRIKGDDHLLLKEEIYADVVYDYVDRSPRDYTLRIDTTQDNESFIKTLAHECVHIKQWVKGEMKLYERNWKYTRWHKQKLRHDAFHYGDLPWEIEAHGRETGLYAEFLEQNCDLIGLIDGTNTDYKLLGPKQMVLF